MKSVVIMGAAGMDYHLFNRIFRGNDAYRVMAFTMADSQNLGTVEGGMRRYPPELSGKLYPQGIQTIRESQLPSFIKEKGVDIVVLAYSDICYKDAMAKAATVLAAGADFQLISPEHTMIKASKPVMAVCAVRTGCGKSQTSRKLAQLLKEKGLKVVAIREPMPYGDLVKQASMRFASYGDLEKYGCTIEEREEYEPYIERGLVVFSGVDYEKVLEEAEKEADVILWDGGNNEVSFYVPGILVVIADPLRPGHEVSSYPGEVNARLADYLIINKEDSAKKEDIETVLKNLKRINPTAKIIHANSPVSIGGDVKGKTALVVEDGPTLTHGNMAFGAGMVAAKKYGAIIIDPKPFLAKGMRKVFDEFRHLSDVVPAMGYSDAQLKDLEETINAAECDMVISGTPIDLSKIIRVNKPIIRVGYELEEIGEPNLNDVVDDFLRKAGL